MTLRILTIIFASVLVCSCSDDNDNQPLADEIIGGYSGNFTYRAFEVTEPSVTENHSAVIAQNADISNMYECSIAGLAYIVILDGLSFTSSGKVSGDIKLYTERADIGQQGKEIAGAGTFSYVNGELTMLWTADAINGEWYFSYNSN